MLIEEGVMVMKDGLAWGVTYEDGRSTYYGWIAPEKAPIGDPRYCKSPADATYANSPHIKELKEGKIVKVRRVTIMEAV